MLWVVFYSVELLKKRFWQFFKKSPPPPLMTNWGISPKQKRYKRSYQTQADG